MTAMNGAVDLGSKLYEPALRKTLFHSRLPLFTFYHFLPSVPNASVKANHMHSSDSKLSSEVWKELFGRNSSSATLGLDESIGEDSNMDIVTDEASNLHDDILADMAEITICVYNSSLAINNGACIPLHERVLAACVIEERSRFNADTLLLLLETEIVAVRVRRNETLAEDKKESYDSFVINSVRLSTPFDSSVFKMSFSFRHNLLFLTCSSGVCLVYEIGYNDMGDITLSHSHNFSTSMILNQCILPLTATKDAFLTLEISNNILRLNCVQDYETFHKASNIMKASFEMPLHMVPLEKTNAVLFLQESGITLKSFLFCIGGEDLDLVTTKYPHTSGKFIVNSYYIPKVKIDSMSSNNYPTASFKHDQILISATHNASVYVLDVFYDKVRHRYSLNISRLFKYKHILSSFKFEPLNNKSYYLEYSNEMGIVESKIVKLTVENAKPTLKTIEELWKNINSYPMFDFKVISSPASKKSIEGPSHEFWALAGAGSNHSIINLKRGYVCDKKSLGLNLYDIQAIIHLFQDKYLLSGDSRTILVSMDSSNNIKPLIELSPGHYLGSSFCHSELVVVTSYFISFINDNKLIYQLKFPYESLLSACSDNLVSMVFYDDDVKSLSFTSFMFLPNESQSEEYMLEDITCDIMEFDPNKVTMLEFIVVSNTKYLVIGSMDAYLYIYKCDNRQLKYINSSKLVLANYNKNGQQYYKSLEYLFVPNKLHVFDDRNNCIITSKNGEYVVLKLDFESNSSVLKYRQYGSVKLSNQGELDIIKTANPHVVFLHCKSLWKLDITKSLFPEQMLLSDSSNLSIRCAAHLDNIDNIKGDDYLLVLQSDQLFKLFIPKTQTTLIRSKKFGVPCMKLFYYSGLDIFIMVKIPGLNTDLPQLLFTEPRTMKVIKSSTDLNTIFKKNEIPICLYEWRVHSSDGFHLNLVVGCDIEGGKLGAVKVLNIHKSGLNIRVRLLGTIQEQTPITHISDLGKNCPASSLFLYSSGSEVISCSYSTVRKTLENRKVLIKTPTPIKKFEALKISIDTYRIIILLLNSSTISTVYNVNENSISDEMKTLDGYYSDLLLMDEETLIQSDYNDEKILMTTLAGEASEKIGYIPRLGKFNIFPPWVPPRDRKDQPKQFLTVGLNGEIDVFKFHNNPDLELALQSNRLRRTEQASQCLVENYFTERNQKLLDTYQNMRDPISGNILSSEYNYAYDEYFHSMII